MSYIIKYGDSYLYDPRYEEYYLTDVELEYEENSCGYLDFGIHSTHPMYTKIVENDYRNPIKVYENEVLLFSGFIYEFTDNFQLERSVKCKGILEYFNQTIVSPFSTYTRGFGTIVPSSYEKIFEWLVYTHNQQCESEKRFIIGINQGTVFDELYDFPEISYDDYPSTMDVISDVFIGSDGVGGYLQVRYDGEKQYVDLLYEHMESNTQILEFGTNLTDYSKTNRSENVVSAVIATGAKLKDTRYTYVDGYYTKTESTPYEDVEYYTRDREYIEIKGSDLTTEFFNNSSDYTYKIYEKTYSYGTPSYSVTSDNHPRQNKTYYINYYGRYKYSTTDVTSFSSSVTYYRYNPDNDRGDTYLTIDQSYIKKASPRVNGQDDLKNDRGYIKNGVTLYSPTMVGKIGTKTVHVSNTNIKTLEELYDAAVNYLDNYSIPRYSIEIKAVDLHIINPNIKPLTIGEFVRVRSKPHNLDDFFICRNVTLDLNNPSQSTYMLGLNYDTLTSEQANKLIRLEKLTNKQIDATNKLTEAEKRRSNSDIRNLSAISQEQDAAITSLFEMIIGG